MMESKHWNTSRFADFLRGIPKPSAATVEEWSDWEEQAQSKKVRYWLAEEGLDYLQHWMDWSASCLYSIYRYIHNHWLVKIHMLTSHLQRRKQHAWSGSFLHVAFDELIDFVEIELAWVYLVFSEEHCKNYKLPFLRFRVWRSPEAGIAYLQWLSTLKKGAQESDANYGESTHQAWVAQEMLILYRWWKDIRTKRVDLSVDTGMEHEIEHERSNRILRLYQSIEEDTVMLTRLIKILKEL